MAAKKPARKSVKKLVRPTAVVASLPVKPTGGVVRAVAAKQDSSEVVSRRWWWPWQRSDKRVRQERLAEVQAQVMNQLKAMRGGAGSEKVSSKPFEQPMLPERFGNVGRNGNGGGDRVFWTLVVGGVLIVAGLLVWGGRTGDSPDRALAQFAELAQERDVPALSAMTDTPAREALLRLFRRVPVDELTWGEQVVVRQEPYAAEGEIALSLPQALAPVMARVSLRRENGAWRVETLDNMGDVIGRLEEIRRVAAWEPAAGVAPSVEGGTLRIEDVSKAPAPDGSMLVSVRVVNASKAPVEQMKVRVMFGDSAGRPMRAMVLCHADGVNVGETLERTWRLPVASHMDSQLAALPMEALTVRAAIVDAR